MGQDQGFTDCLTWSYHASCIMHHTLYQYHRETVLLHYIYYLFLHWWNRYHINIPLPPFLSPCPVLMHTMPEIVPTLSLETTWSACSWCGWERVNQNELGRLWSNIKILTYVRGSWGLRCGVCSEVRHWTQKWQKKWALIRPVDNKLNITTWPGRQETCT